ncbi:MAG: aromatic ring-hydroxylating dioxygenase subunit alpha [Burkholderiales bacterium]|nr:aromatic ring-hydroxylating dioxygenase subunit alpha [Burkholderiales bacterium]
MTPNPNLPSDEGSAYGRRPPMHDAELTEVGPGTPCGELLRRYWHPIALSAEAGSRPRKVRVLGEDLILFRDGQGRPGLLTPHCAHRGTSLYYGKVDDDGIRCCYHGWKFDVRGRCLDQPCEPQGGLHRERIRQPWYPLEERYGLVFAYLGPPRKRPILPRWNLLENLPPSEKVLASGPTGFGVGADHTVREVPWNWLQNMENTLDPFHIPILHASFSGIHFVPDMALMPEVIFEHIPLGVRYRAIYRNTSRGHDMVRVSPIMFPNVRSVPDGQLRLGPSIHVTWMVPIDDTHHCLYYASRVPADFAGTIGRAKPANRAKVWSEMTEAEHQAEPDDWEAQLGQGPIAAHSDEHLVSSDRGVVMYRRLLRQQIQIVRDGGDPIGVSFDHEGALTDIEAGNFALDAPVPATVPD